MIDLIEHGGHFGGGSGGIKKIQHISTNWANNSELMKTVAIEPVDTNKAMLLLRSPSGDAEAGRSYFVGVFNSGSEVQISRGYGSSGTPPLHFSVIEFQNLKSKQTGMFTSSSSADYTLAFEPVDINKSLLFINPLYKFSGISSIGIPYGAFTSANAAKVFNIISSQDYHWQLIEFK